MTGFIELVMAGLTSGLVIGLAALSVTLVFGIAKFSNAATGDQMALGAYAAYLGSAVTGSLLLGGLIGVVAGALTALIGYQFIFRKLAGRSSVTALLASIGFAFFLRALLGLIFGHQQKTFEFPLMRPWRILGVKIFQTDVMLIGVALAALALAFAILHLTPIGRRMRAVADDPSLARVSGIAPRRVMFALWAMAGGIASVAGLMLGLKTVISPEMGWDMLLPAFAAAILGGLGNPVGAVLGGVLLGVIQEVSTPYVGFTYKIAISFLALLLVLLFRPQGLFGRLEGVR